MYRKELENLKDFSIFTGRCVAKLDQNENPYPIPEYILSEMVDSVKNSSYNRYTGISEIEKLKSDLALYTGKESKNIAIGAGADSFIHSIIEIFAINKGKIAVLTPTYPIYKLFATINGVETIEMPLRYSDFSIDETIFFNSLKGVAVCFITYPNNPTGNLFDRNLIEKAIKTFSNVLFVIDEAYYEFSGDTFVDLMDLYDNIVVIRTFSKFFAVPSLRIGYVIAKPEYISLFERCQFVPYNVSLFSVSTARILLKYVDEFERVKDIILKEKDKIYDFMKDINNINVFPSVANFLFFKSKDNLVERLYEAGIFVRDFGKLDGKNSYFRATIGKTEENRHFMDFFKKVV